MAFDILGDKEKLELIFNTIPDAVIISRLNDGRYVLVNDGFTGLTWYTREELIGKSSLEINIWKDPSKRQIVIKLLHEKSVCDNLEAVFIRKDGKHLYGLTSARIIHLEGIPHILSITREITKQKESEEALRKSEARFRSYFELPLTGRAITSPTKGWIDVNSTLCDMLGYTREELVKMTWDRLTHPDDLASDLIQFNRVLSGETDGYTLEKRFMHKDGHFLYTNLAVHCLRCPDGSVDYFVALILDITKAKEDENELHRSEQRYRLLAENITDVIWVLDPGTMHFLYISSSVRHLLGYTSDELLRIPFPDILAPEVREPFLQRTRSRVEDFLSNSKTHTGYRNEVLHLRKDGSLIWTEVVNQYYLNGSTGKVEIQGVSRDIAVRKRTEETLRETNAYLENLVNYANAPIIVWDPQFRITRFNHAFELLTGRTESEVMGKSLEILFPIEHLQSSMDLIRKTLTGERWETVEIKILHKDQKVRTVLWNSVTLFAPDGKTPTATIAQGQDITNRKQAEDKLRILNQTLELRVSDRTRELESINKELMFHLNEIEQLTYISSHDLQEPLRTLINFAQLVRDEYGGKLDELGNIYIDFIYNSANRMRMLVKGLLDYSLIGKESEKTIVDCNVIIAEVISDLADLIHGNNALITIDELPVLPGYATELRLLFQNLINNSIKYHRKEIQPEIKITAENRENDWLFSVKDNGIGIEEKNKEKIFVIFKRMHNRNEYEGIGIGLAHCKKIVELHGGKIWVESAPGTGSMFIFTIPKQ